MQIDVSSPQLDRTEAVAERADIFRTALALLREFQWGAPVGVDDAVYLAKFLSGGTYSA